jgi:hypothetical protein
MKPVYMKGELNTVQAIPIKPKDSQELVYEGVLLAVGTPVTVLGYSDNHYVVYIEDHNESMVIHKMYVSMTDLCLYEYV